MLPIFQSSSAQLPSAYGRASSMQERTLIRGKTSVLRTPRFPGGRPMFPVGGNGSVAPRGIAQRLCISRRASCHAVFAPGDLRIAGDPDVRYRAAQL